jgi:hypothetical protein
MGPDRYFPFFFPELSMAAMGVSGGGFEFELCSVGGRWVWKVVANNVAGAGQSFFVSDVRTPFGRLSDVDSPIPGDVVASMAESVVQFQQQLAPLLQLTGPSSFAVTVTEGDPTLDVGSTPFTNVGAFGSFMNVSATPGSPWLSASPSFFSGVGKNQSAQASLRVNPATLLASGSPYVGVVNLQDNRIPATVFPVQATITVLPRPAIAVDQATVTLTFSLSTQTDGGAQTVVVTNSGPATSLLTYALSKVQNTSSWLQYSPGGDGPVASGDTSSFVLSARSASVPRIAGTYTDTIKVSSVNASNNPVFVTVNLVVGP